MYHKGDKIWVELTIEDANCYETIDEVKTKHGWFDKRLIKNHIPAPRPIEVGCIVTSSQNKDYQFKVLAIDEDQAWVKTIGLCNRSECPLSILTRVD